MEPFSLQNLPGSFEPMVQSMCLQKRDVSKPGQDQLPLQGATGEASRLPGEHVEEGLYDLLCERHAHLYPQPLKQGEEETQHFVGHI